MHPEYSFRFLYWSQKLTLKNVRLQIGTLWYVQIHERAENIVEGIVGEFCLILSFIKAVSLQLGRGIAK